MKSYSELPNLLARATSGVGVLVSLGEAFTRRGISEIDANIVPKLRVSRGGLGVIPQVTSIVCPTVLVHNGGAYLIFVQSSGLRAKIIKSFLGADC